LKSGKGIEVGMERQVRPLLASTPKFIQMRLPLLPLKPMAELPHTLIDPSALMAVKANKVE
jgi:hypothetical protein